MVIDWQVLGTVLLFSLIAGLGTGVGGLIAVIHKPGRRSFGLLMGVAAGVMITLAFMELVNEAWELAGFWTATIGFSAGAIFMFLVDFFIPHIRFGEVEADVQRDNSIYITTPCQEKDGVAYVVETAASARDAQGMVYPGTPHSATVQPGREHPGAGSPEPGERNTVYPREGAPTLEAAGAPGGNASGATTASHFTAAAALPGGRRHRGEHFFPRGSGGRRRGLRHASARRNHISDYRLLKTGLLIAIGITIHNIPEGIAVGAGFMHMPKFGMFIALAILLHNIPEGIAVAMPLCKSGVCRWDSFKAALFSGLAEPIGALVAVLFLASFEALIPAALAFAGGVMVFITLDELVPAAREHGHQHFTAIGIILGAIFVFLLSGIFGV
jgi:zinc transporter ZupT